MHTERPHISLDEYLRGKYEPECEYLDGITQPRSLPDYVHSRVHCLLVAYLGAREAELGFLTLSPIHMRVASNRFRIPDVCAVVEAPADRRFVDASHPPLFTIEISSSDESWPSLRGKVTDHLAMGVPAVIIADPYNKTVMIAKGSQPLRELAPPLIAEIDIPGKGVLKIDFDELYRQLG